MELEQVRQRLAKIKEELYATEPGGQAGNAAWLQVLCGLVNQLPENEAIEWREVHAEQVVRVLWYTPEVLNKMKGRRIIA